MGIVNRFRKQSFFFSQGWDVLEHDRKEVVTTDQGLINSTRNDCCPQVSWL